MMIEPFAQKIAVSIKNTNPEKTTSIEIMQYGIIMFINGFIVLFLSLSIGLATGKFTETLLTLISFAILRFFSGGFHFKSALHCIIVSIFLMTVIPHIPINSTWNAGLLISSIILVALFAPSNIKNQTRIPEKYHTSLKYISMFIVSLNFFVASEIITICFFLQSVMLIKFRKE